MYWWIVALILSFFSIKCILYGCFKRRLGSIRGHLKGIGFGRERKLEDEEKRHLHLYHLH